MSLDELAALLADPPIEYRPEVRWWLAEGLHTDETLRREIDTAHRLGFGGMEDVRFRGPVSPGDRLVVISKTNRLNRRQSVFETQGFVGNNLVFHAKIIGVILNPAANATAERPATVPSQTA